MHTPIRLVSMPARGASEDFLFLLGDGTCLREGSNPGPPKVGKVEGTVTECDCVASGSDTTR